MRLNPRLSLLLGLALAASACAFSEERSSPSRTFVDASTPLASALDSTGSPAPARPTLPPGFPLMPGSVSAGLPDDPTVVARWTVPAVGSAAYDFYRRALPEAGLAIVGTYPTERAALVRFRDSGGMLWQMLAELAGNRTQVTVQTDRP